MKNANGKPQRSCWRIRLRRRLRSRKHMTRLLMPLLLLLCLTTHPLTICAQQPQGSESSANEVQRLKTGLANALARVEQLTAERDAARELLKAQADELAAAKNVIAVSASERAAADRALALADKALAAQQHAIEVQEKALNNTLALIDRYETRITKLEDKVDRANKRTLWGTVGGAIAGAALVILKPF